MSHRYPHHARHDPHPRSGWSAREATRPASGERDPQSEGGERQAELDSPGGEQRPVSQQPAHDDGEGDGRGEDPMRTDGSLVSPCLRGRRPTTARRRTRTRGHHPASWCRRSRRRTPWFPAGGPFARSAGWLSLTAGGLFLVAQAVTATFDQATPGADPRWRPSPTWRVRREAVFPPGASPQEPACSVDETGAHGYRSFARAPASRPERGRRAAVARRPVRRAPTIGSTRTAHSVVLGIVSSAVGTLLGGVAVVTVGVVWLALMNA
jgi:hypothetical protein